MEGGGRTINPGGRLGPPDVARLVGEGGRQCLWEAQSPRCVQGRCGQCSDAFSIMKLFITGLNYKSERCTKM